MEDNGGARKWDLKGNEDIKGASALTVRGYHGLVIGNLNGDDPRPAIHMSLGDPSGFACFRTTPIAEDAISDSVRSAKFNCYSPGLGIPVAKKAVAEYLSHDLPYNLSPDDIFLTAGADHAIEVIITALARPGANILVPKPGYPVYDARAAFSQFEVRHYDLLPGKGWEVDLDGVEEIADNNTAAIVIVSPGNPCGNVFTYEHLQKVAETAKRLGILVIADEVYAHICFGDKPFVPMGVFGSITPVLTLGSLSKRLIIPGWRLGWIAMTDPNGTLQKSGFVECIKSFLNITPLPVTFVQGAVPNILQRTTKEFFSNIINIIKNDADICSERLKDICGISCPHKPEGSMSLMAKLDLSLLEGIDDDIDFCIKLAKEECVTVMPGVAVGMKNWVRITFAIDPNSLEEALARIKAFCLRHEKKI